MKKNLLILVVILSLNFSGYAKREEIILPEDESGKVVFTDVVNMENTAIDILFSRGLEWFMNISRGEDWEWFMKAYGYGMYVIQMKDKEGGKIIVNAAFPVDIVTLLTKNRFGVVKYSISLYLKDNRFKYNIDDFYHDGSASEVAFGKSFGEIRNEKSTRQLTKGQWNYLKYQINEEIIRLIENLKICMAKEAEDEKDNW